MGYAESKLADSKARWRSTGIVALRDAKLKASNPFFTYPRFPDEVLDLDKSVRTLDVTQNKLVEIPMEISKLVNMQRLILASNHIQRLPSNVGKLQSLKVMILDGNEITSLPDEYLFQCNVCKLYEVNVLSHWLLTVFLLSVGELVRLEKLSISGNMLVSLPETIGCLHNLSLLNVSSNKLKHLPESVGICFSLEELQANDNLIEELPASICNLAQLKSLSLNNNKVSQVSSIFWTTSHHTCSQSGIVLSEDHGSLKVVSPDIRVAKRPLIWGIPLGDKAFRDLRVSKEDNQTIPPSILKDCKALQNFSLHDNPISMSQFQQMDGFEEFEERRKKKFDKQLDSNVMIGSKGLDEGVDL
ncbi:hypothetical protein V6N12_043764 [Hibiscus sabdariffa]|uniref:Uncharacterized protein n=1 Tax=Hibiscus sabdariffa TaxID=183260 RepID=A0ABR2DFQ3_9ROSI